MSHILKRIYAHIFNFEYKNHRLFRQPMILHIKIKARKEYPKELMELPYVITDGDKVFLFRDNRGNFIPTKNRSVADIWESKQKAVNVLNSCVNKNLRSRYMIMEVEAEKPKENIEQVVKVRNYENLKPNNEVAKRIINSPIVDNDLERIKNKLAELYSYVQSSEERQKELTNALSDVDKEISDIHHYIEFGKFNCYQGWLAFSMLRNRLKQRRKIKDELTIINQLGESIIDLNALENIKKGIERLDSRTYQPRRLNELFE